jgi:hypothetical protein
MIRTVTKLVAKAKNDCQSSRRPRSNEPPFGAGSRRLSTRSVIAKAKTPSLKASIRSVSRSSDLSGFIVRPGTWEDTSGHLEFALRHLAAIEDTSPELRPAPRDLGDRVARVRKPFGEMG